MIFNRSVFRVKTKGSVMLKHASWRRFRDEISHDEPICEKMLKASLDPSPRLGRGHWDGWHGAWESKEVADVARLAQI